MHFGEAHFQKFSRGGGGMLPAPPRNQAFGPSVYRAVCLLYHKNPPTSKLNEIPAYRIVFPLHFASFYANIGTSQKGDIDVAAIQDLLLTFCSKVPCVTQRKLCLYWTLNFNTYK